MKRLFYRISDWWSYNRPIRRGRLIDHIRASAHSRSQMAHYHHLEVQGLRERVDRVVEPNVAVGRRLDCDNRMVILTVEVHEDFMIDVDPDLVADAIARAVRRRLGEWGWRTGPEGATG